MLKDTLQADLKKAMLSRDTDRVEVLKGLKSAILYGEVAEKKRETGFTDEEILAVFKKESKKRQDAIDLYSQANNKVMADKEAAEKVIIDSYLPKELSENEVAAIIEQTLEELGLSELQKQDMGRVIGAVKSRVGAQADGSLIARLVQKKVVE